MHANHSKEFRNTLPLVGTIFSIRDISDAVVCFTKARQRDRRGAARGWVVRTRTGGEPYEPAAGDRLGADCRRSGSSLNQRTGHSAAALKVCRQELVCRIDGRCHEAAEPIQEIGTIGPGSCFAWPCTSGSSDCRASRLANRGRITGSYVH